MPAPMGVMASAPFEPADASSATDVDNARPAPQCLGGRWGRVAGGVALAAAATFGAFALVGGASHGGGSRAKSRTEGVVGLDVLTGLADLLEAGATVIKGAEHTYEVGHNESTALKHLQEATVGEQGLATALGNPMSASGPAVEALRNGTYAKWMQDPANYPMIKDLWRKRNKKHDGNLCHYDEEEHAFLCYKKCSLLTNGEYQVRTAAMSCCRSSPCSLLNTHTQLTLPCTGYDVAGDSAGGGCPHSVGGCRADEEFQNNMCYKRCAILTLGHYCFRTAADTCCKYNGVSQCLDPSAYQTLPQYAVAGGELEEDYDPATADHSPHMPLKDMAEATE